MTKQRRSYQKPISLVCRAIAVIMILEVASPVLAASSLFQGGSIPTLTPPYTLPPPHTFTPVPPGPSKTASPPWLTSSPPVRTATLPAQTPTPLGTTLPPPGVSATSIAPTPLGPPPDPSPSIMLTCGARIEREDVVAGDTVQYSILVTNVGAAPAGSVILRDQVAQGIELLRISATQGSAEVEAGLVVLRLGIIESGQSALAVLDLRTSASVLAGQIFVQQADTYFDGGHAMCNIVAFGTRPDHLPRTGEARRQP